MARHFHIVAETVSLTLVLGLAFEAGAWDELGPLPQARGDHPEFFRAGAVNEVELNGERYWIFTGDGVREGGVATSDAEAYRVAALDARRNLLRHLSGNAPHVDAEVSGITTAYSFAEGNARRVVCLVPVENVSIRTNTPAIPVQAPQTPSTPTMEPPSPFGSMQRFSPPELPTPSIP